MDRVMTELVEGIVTLYSIKFEQTTKQIANLKLTFALRYLKLITNTDWTNMIPNTHFDKCNTIAEVKHECDVLLNTN